MCVGICVCLSVSLCVSLCMCVCVGKSCPSSLKRSCLLHLAHMLHVPSSPSTFLSLPLSFSLHRCSANFATQQLKKKTSKAGKVAIKKSTANERFEELMRNKIKYSLNIYVPRIQYICGGPASGDHTHTHTHTQTYTWLASHMAAVWLEAHDQSHQRPLDRLSPSVCPPCASPGASSLHAQPTD